MTSIGPLSHGLHSWTQTPFTRTGAIGDEGPPPSHMTSFNLSTSAENFCPRTLPASQQAVTVLLFKTYLLHIAVYMLECRCHQRLEEGQATDRLELEL